MQPGATVPVHQRARSRPLPAQPHSLTRVVSPGPATVCVGNQRATAAAARRSPGGASPGAAGGLMMMESLTTTRDLVRVYDLATILIRYGFGDMVSRMRLEGLLARAGDALGFAQLAELAALPTPVR